MPTTELPPRNARLRMLILCAAVAVVAAGLLAVALRKSAPAPVPSAAVDDRPPREPLDDVPELVVTNPGYLGPDACRECHRERVEEFQTTAHHRTSRLPDAAELAAWFDPPHTGYATRTTGLRFEMSRTGDGFFQSVVHRAGSEPVRATRRIDLVYGAAAADVVFHTWRDDGLFQLPAAWLRPLQAWGNAPGLRDGVANLDRETTARCLECHNTWFAHRPGTINQFRRSDAILGVTCERCHGPARDHVAWHKAHPGSASGEAIVRPGQLSRERQMDVCAQCHSNANKRRGPAFSYVPGEPLAAHFRTDVGKHPEEDHTTNQDQYVRQSRCFQATETLTCTTCHDPHRDSSAEHSAASVCNQCHTPADCPEQPRLPEAVRGRCVDCHMPFRPVVNVYFHTRDDDFVPLIRRHEHRIAVHPDARDEVLLDWHRAQPGLASAAVADRLAQQLAAHWLAEADALRAEHRFLAASAAYRQSARFVPAAEMTEKLREVIGLQLQIKDNLTLALRQLAADQTDEARRALEQVLAIDPDHAQAQARLGTLALREGRRELALQLLAEAARDDPDDAYAEGMLGWLDYLDGRPGPALEHLRRADDIEPWNPQIAYEIGLASMKLDDWPAARDAFRRGTMIDPGHVGNCQGLAHALLHLQQPAEALPWARRAVGLTERRNLDMLLTLSDVYAAAGRPDDALETLATAQALALTSNPQLLPQLRHKADQLRHSATAKVP